MKVAEVKKVLIHKGVTELFHVNSVITSLTFIDNGGLLSRETVEEYNLPQTDQQSDDVCGHGDPQQGQKRVSEVAGHHY